MQTPLIETRSRRTVRRPLDIVRAQFFDFEHHIRRNVHKGTTFTILESAPDRFRLRVETRLGLLPLRDEWLVHRLDDGSILHSFVTGPLAGGGIEIRFSPAGEGSTVVDGRIFAPKRGVVRLFAPLFRAILRKTGERSLDEDLIDLEQGGYEPAR